MTTLNYIQKKFNLDLDQKSPIEIANFGRDQLAELFAELGFRTIVEIGVCAGEYSEVLCKANPEATIFGVDPFISHKEYKDYALKSSIDKYHAKAQEVEDRYPNYALKEKYSMDAVKDFADQSIDAVYIDANHKYEFVVEDIAQWTKKIRKDGIISGHDYSKIRQPTNTHVYQAVHGYTDSHQIKPWFILGQNAMIKGEIRDRLRSWCWVK